MKYVHYKIVLLGAGLLVATPQFQSQYHMLSSGAFLRGSVANNSDKDSDEDGVSNKKDKCDDTPKGVKVDSVGCPTDKDKDYVADYLDICPTVKGLSILHGCPDADQDGIPDAEDHCANTPAGVRVDAGGCPFDTDGDGILDYRDNCSTTPAGLQVDAHGCPLIPAR